MNAALLRAMESPKPIHRTLPKNLGLLGLIRAKRVRDWKPSVEELKQGFRGWHQRGYLPHFDAPGVTQFVTFQLHDAFPVTRRPEFEDEYERLPSQRSTWERGIYAASTCAVWRTLE